MNLLVREDFSVSTANVRLASKLRRLMLGDTSVNLAVEMYTADDDGHRHTDGHSSPDYYVKADEDATFKIAAGKIKGRYQCFADLGVGGEQAVLERGLAAAHAVEASDYYACDIAPALAEGAARLAKQNGFKARAFQCDIFSRLPFNRTEALIGILGLTIGNLETYKSPVAVKDRLVEVFRRYSQAISRPSSTLKPHGGLLVGWDANMKLSEIEQCYDNPPMSALIRSCPQRVADTSKFDYHVATRHMSLNPDEEVCFVSLGLRARVAHTMPCGNHGIPVTVDQFIPVLNTDRFSVPFMAAAFDKSGWKSEASQSWSASGRVRYQHCTLA